VDEINRRSRRALSSPFRGFEPWFEGRLDRLRERYRKVIAWSLRHRAVPVFGGVLALFAAFSFIPLGILGIESFPAEDDGLFQLEIEMAPGTSLVSTDGAMADLERQL